MAATPLSVERVSLERLHAHPRNYRQHPPDQLAHIIRSIEEHGVYRNIVVAEDYTILAGHGVVKALREMGRAEAPVIRLPIAPDSPQALRLLAGDNEIGRLAEVDDRLFAEILHEVKDLGGLLGTGFDEMMLANLAFITRGELRDAREAAEWAGAGMPEYDDAGMRPFRLVLSFRTIEDRARFAAEKELSLDSDKPDSLTWFSWWPPRDREDTRSVRFEKAEA